MGKVYEDWTEGQGCLHVFRKLHVLWDKAKCEKRRGMGYDPGSRILFSTPSHSGILRYSIISIQTCFSCYFKIIL